MATELKAIETTYQNHRFRSRLEARWAVFFDVVGFRYVYEPEGYDLGGIWYLPDFYLPDPKAFLEIKPEDPTDEQRHKAQLLAMASGKEVWIISGQPYWATYRIWGFDPITDEADEHFSPTGNHMMDCSPYWFVQCRRCIQVGMESEEYHNPEYDGPPSCRCSGFCCSEHGGWPTGPRLLSGYEAARKARFDSGDNIVRWRGPAAMVRANDNITGSEIWLVNKLHELGGLGHLDEQQRWQLYGEAKSRLDFPNHKRKELDAVLAMLEL